MTYATEWRLHHEEQPLHEVASEKKKPILMLEDSARKLSAGLARLQHMLSLYTPGDDASLDSPLPVRQPVPPLFHTEQSLDTLCISVQSLADEISTRICQLSGQMSDVFEAYEAELGSYKRKLDEQDSASRRLKTLLHVLPAGVVLIDGSGIIQQCNAAAIELLGEPLEGEKWLDVIQRCFSPRKDDGHEVSLKDGRRVSIAIRSIDKEPGQLILLTDLTETRELQARLSRHERLSAMGRMVASLAHQVRTPLSAAMLYAGHLTEADISTEMRIKCAGKLKSRLLHLEQQVRDMLVFAKGGTPAAERMSVGALFDALKQAVEPLISRKNVKIDWQCSAGHRSLLCNREALIGACLNLINNAMEAAPDGVHIQVCFECTTTRKLLISVSDDGPGFPEEMRHRLKEAFFTTKPQGTGLGLAVVQAIARAHQGEFDLVPGAGGGTTAVLVLPTGQESEDKNPPRAAQEPAN